MNVRRHCVCILSEPLTATHRRKHTYDSLFFRTAEKISSNLLRFQHPLTQLEKLFNNAMTYEQIYQYGGEPSVLTRKNPVFIYAVTTNQYRLG